MVHAMSETDGTRAIGRSAAQQASEPSAHAARGGTAGKATLTENLTSQDAANALDVTLDTLPLQTAALSRAVAAVDFTAAWCAAHDLRQTIEYAERLVTAPRTSTSVDAIRRLSDVRVVAHPLLEIAPDPSPDAIRERTSTNQHAGHGLWKAEEQRWKTARGATSGAPHTTAPLRTARDPETRPAASANPSDVTTPGAAAKPLPRLDLAPPGGRASRTTQERGVAVEPAAMQQPALGAAGGMWEHTFGEASTPVGKLGRVQAPKGVYLRVQPAPGATSPGAPVPFNGLVYVERRTTQGHANERWCYVIATEAGAAGFCEERYLAIDPPEPTATLRRTAGGERLAAIAEAAYGPATGENNARLYVQALYLANRDRAGVALDHVDLGFQDRALRGDEEEQTLLIYKGAKVIAGDSIWIPSKPFIEQLKAAGAVTGGSTAITEAWNTAKGAVSGVIDGAKYVAGFIGGLLEGAYNAIADLFKGAVDMVEAVLKVIWNLITGHPGLIKDMLMGWVDKMKLAWEHRGEIADELLKKWNADNPWDRGLFQGDVLGWVMMTVLLILVTMGEDAPAALGGIAMRWPQLVKLLKAVDTLGDVTTYLGAAAKAVQVPGKAIRFVAGKLGKAERAAEHVAEDVGKDVGRAGKKAEDAAEQAADTAGKGSRKAKKKAAEFITIAGYAQHPRMYPWLKNADGAVRSIDEAVEIARIHGVEIPDDILLKKVRGKMLPDNTYAQYFSHYGTDPNKMVRWEEFYDKHLDGLVVLIKENVFQSDEAIVAILAHEMHELSELRRIFEESGGALSRRKLYNLINPGIARNLHDQAWDVADRLVLAMRKGAK